MADYQYDPSFRFNDELARELLSLTEESALSEADHREPSANARSPVLPLRNADAIVAHIEINNRHGVGVLLNRIFGHYTNILSVRSENHFAGKQEFGGLDTCIAHENTSPAAVAAKVRRILNGHSVGRILCVPYYPDDVRNALALQEITGAPLVTWLMDDQNVCAGGIPDGLMNELLGRSRLRLAISPELATCYEVKYRRKFWLMPPLTPARHTLSCPLPEDEVLSEPRTGAILGNIWGQRWLDLLRQTVRGTGIKLRWYSTNHLRYLSGSPGELAGDGIEIPPGPPLPDPELVDVLRRTAFAVVPTGTLDEKDDRRFIAQLSLPSRIPFIMATSHTPILVLGHRATGAARFVHELGIGAAADYTPDSFREAVQSITSPAVNLGFRRRALALAGRFIDTGAAEWIWQSLEQGAPFDLRYEDLLRRPRPEIEALVRETGQAT